MIQKKEIFNEGFLKLCETIGLALRDKIYEDSQNMKTEYKNVDLLTHNCESYLSEREPGLVVLVKSLTRVKTLPKAKDSSLSYGLCLVLEQIYSTRNSKFVGPMSFTQEEVKWSFSGSKGMRLRFLVK